VEAAFFGVKLYTAACWHYIFSNLSMPRIKLPISCCRNKHVATR